FIAATNRCHLCVEALDKRVTHAHGPAAIEAALSRFTVGRPLSAHEQTRLDEAKARIAAGAPGAPTEAALLRAAIRELGNIAGGVLPLQEVPEACGRIRKIMEGADAWIREAEAREANERRKRASVATAYTTLADERDDLRRKLAAVSAGPDDVW